MSVDEPGWEVDPDDEWGLAVLATVGRQLKLPPTPAPSPPPLLQPPTMSWPVAPLRSTP